MSEAKPLPRAAAVCAAGDWHGDVADCVVLDFDDRHRRRLRMRGVRGLDFLLDLGEATALRGGDALALEDGRFVEVVAAPEKLAEISSPTPDAMVRIAWHLGNRHLPVQLAGRRLRIRRDHVIAAMVEGLGGVVREIEAPFDPEGGAYAQGSRGQDSRGHDSRGHDSHGQGSHGHAHGHHRHHD